MMGTGMEHAFIPRAEHDEAMENVKERVTKSEQTCNGLGSELTTKVPMRLFLWVIGSIIGVLVVVFGVQLAKLDSLMKTTHSIELKVVGIQKDIETLKREVFKREKEMGDHIKENHEH